MARLTLTSTREKTATTNTKPEMVRSDEAKLFINLGLRLKDGGFVKLPFLPIYADNLISQKRAVSKEQAQTEWGKRQLLINASIDELLLAFEEIDAGNSAFAEDCSQSKFVKKLSIELRRKGDEISEEDIAEAGDLSDLLA